MQGGFFLSTFLIGLRHIMPGEGSRGGGFDSFCPFGGIETLWSYLAAGSTLKTTNLLNFTIILGVAGVSLVAGRAFCGWMCPLGTMQDYLAGWADRLSGGKDRPRGKKSKARFPLQVPPRVDKWLRYLKYLVLAAVLIASASAVYPPLRDICPARAIFGFDLKEAWLVIVLLAFVLSSSLVRRFTCKYLCPLGAALAVFNKISPIHINIDQQKCTNCGRCENECPVDIPAIPNNIRSTECIRCLECLETCAIPNTVDLQLG